MTGILTRKSGFSVVIAVIIIVLSLMPWNNSLANKAFAKEATDKINENEVTCGVNDSFLVEIPDMFDGAAEYTYESSNKDIATVDERGCVYTKKKGTTTITVIGTYEGTSKENKVKINVVMASLNEAYKDGLWSAGYLDINNRNDRAKYFYETSDSSVIKLTDDRQGFIGIKYGTAYLSVTENYKGKYIKIGTAKVQIVKSQLKDKTIAIAYDGDGYVSINYAIGPGDYRYFPEDKNIVEVGYRGDITGKKYGKTKISVTETFKGKTRKVGTVMVEVLPSTLSLESKNIQIGLHPNKQALTSVLKILYKNQLAYYTCETTDKSILTAEKETLVDYFGKSVTCYLHPLKMGKTTLTVYEIFRGKKRSLGTVNVTVKDELSCFTFDPNFMAEDGVLRGTFYLDEELNNYFTIDDCFIIDPEYGDPYSDIIFTSSNENVIKIDGKGRIILGSQGTAILTATYGDYHSELYVTVE